MLRRPLQVVNGTNELRWNGAVPHPAHVSAAKDGSSRNPGEWRQNGLGVKRRGIG